MGAEAEAAVAEAAEEAEADVAEAAEAGAAAEPHSWRTAWYNSPLSPQISLNFAPYLPPLVCATVRQREGSALRKEETRRTADGHIQTLHLYDDMLVFLVFLKIPGDPSAISTFFDAPRRSSTALDDPSTFSDCSRRPFSDLGLRICVVKYAFK